MLEDDEKMKKREFAKRRQQYVVYTKTLEDLKPIEFQET